MGNLANLGVGGNGVTITAPDDLSGLTVWLVSETEVFSDAGTTPAVDGATVQQWNDQSGNDNHVLQGTAGSRPLYETNEVNSLPVVRFGSGGSKFLKATFGAALDQPFTVVMVRKLNAINGGTYMDSSNNLAMLIDTPGTTTSTYRVDSGASLTTGTIATTNWEIQSNINNGATSVIRINSVQQAGGNAGTTALAGLTVGARGGGTTGASVDFAEVLIYNRRLSNNELMALERYLATRYAISI